MTNSPDSKNKKPADVTEVEDVKSVEQTTTSADPAKEMAKGADLWTKIKAGAAKVGELAEDATELGKLKIEIVRIESAINKQYMKCGIKVWELHEQKRLNDLQKELSQEFEALASLHDELRETRKQADSISLID